MTDLDNTCLECGQGCEATRTDAIKRLLEVVEPGHSVLMVNEPGRCALEGLFAARGIVLYGAGPRAEGRRGGLYKEFFEADAAGLMPGGKAMQGLLALPRRFNYIFLGRSLEGPASRTMYLVEPLLDCLADGGTLAVCIREAAEASLLRALGLGLMGSALASQGAGQKVLEMSTPGQRMHIEIVPLGQAGSLALLSLSRPERNGFTEAATAEASLSCESFIAMRAKVRLLESVVRQKDATIDRIYSSNGWKFLVRLYRMRDRFVSPVMHYLSYLSLPSAAEFLKGIALTGPAWPWIMLKRLLKGKRDAYIDRVAYARFKDERDLRPEELERRRATRFDYEPLISIAVPVFNTPVEVLGAMVDSVVAQTYRHWELCLADGGSSSPALLKALGERAAADPRIKLRLIGQNLGIAGNTNAALGMCTGEFVALLDHDDLIAPEALYEVVSAVNVQPEADFLYSDEDKVTANGKHLCEPHFKPDFSPDLLRSQNYITHLTVIRRALLEQVGGFREGFEGAQDYDLILRATEAARKVVHIPKVLYHWRMGRQSTASAAETKMYAFESGKRALAEHLSRMGMDFDVRDANILGSYRVLGNSTPAVLLSVIIPSKDHSADLRRCIDGLREKTEYKNMEIIVVENNSVEEATFRYYKELESTGRARVVKWDMHFNYGAINNFGVRYAKGEVLLLLNNDVDPLNPDWVLRMLEHAVRPEVGAVGAKLLYPDGTVQHGGVILGIGGVAGHSHKYFPRTARGYMNRLNLVQNLSAVTGACLMIKRSVYEGVGGFDENLPVAFNDIDLCMKIRQRGYLIVWTPYAELYHYESKSRGAESTPEKQARFQREIEYFKGKWGQELEKGDPYYSPNLTVHLEDFSIRV